MSIELDHVFICVSPDAPEAGQLKNLGLIEGPPNRHPGQGTACRRFFFRNAYLELLWVHDVAEAQSQQVQPVRLWQRWSGRASGANPFGLCFRPALNERDPPRFKTWDYHPPYLPPQLSIGVGLNAEIMTEPALFWLGFAVRPDLRAEAEQPLREHSAGLCEMTRVALVRPGGKHTSPELKAVAETGLIQFRTGEAHLLELGFDGEARGRQADLRPVLPLVLSW